MTPISKGWGLSGLGCVLALACSAFGCGPPSFDVRSLDSLPRVARAPAAEAERMLIAARRDESRGEAKLATAQKETQEARLAAERARAGQGDQVFARTRQSYLESVEVLRGVELRRLRGRSAVQAAKYELAKATVARDNAISEGVGIDVEDYKEAVRDAQGELDEIEKGLTAQRLQVSILKRALHTARVSSLKAAAGGD